jgi:hypothetical protein
MADPVRAEFWGDEIVDLRQFDMSTQRSTREVASALVLPVDGGVKSDAMETERRSIHTLWSPDTLLVFPKGVHIEQELTRTWGEAQHHIDLARRRGEDVPDRDELFEEPKALLAAITELAAIEEVVDPEDAEIVFPIRAPEQIGRDIPQLRRLVRDHMRTIILCDNAGQAERLIGPPLRKRNPRRDGASLRIHDDRPVGIFSGSQVGGDLLQRSDLLLRKRHVTGTGCSQSLREMRYGNRFGRRVQNLHPECRSAFPVVSLKGVASRHRKRVVGAERAGNVLTRNVAANLIECRQSGIVVT